MSLSRMEGAYELPKDYPKWGKVVVNMINDLKKDLKAKMDKIEKSTEHSCSIAQSALDASTANTAAIAKINLSFVRIQAENESLRLENRRLKESQLRLESQQRKKQHPI